MLSDEPSRPIPQRVLIVEDVEDTRTSLQELLEIQLPGQGLNVEVDVAADGAQGLQKLLDKPYSLVITDLRMPKLDGMKLIREIDDRKLPVTVIVTTGHGDVKDAVAAMRMGAYDFIPKPPDPEHFPLIVARALRERQLQDEVSALREELGHRHSFQNVLSHCPKMLDVFELIAHIADTTSTVLIRGETGTGKEQIARAVHEASRIHRNGPFIAVNCGALNENLLESELFGHEKGSFTGAAGKRVGRFELAHGGTLFLDEIGDVPMSMQIKLLRVLQERRFERVGGSDPIEIDVRVVAATHQDMERLVQEGKFREDLYYRLNVVRIDVPPLRDRTEDIPILVNHFSQRFTRSGKTPPVIEPEAMEVLKKAQWPGNVRQLENAIERACVTARDGTIRVKNLPTDLQDKAERARHPFQPDLERSLPEQLAELTAAFEERYLRKALRRTRGHVGKCAKITGLSRRSITDKISHYKIDKADFKKE